MTVTDIYTFCCSSCGELIPDRELEELVRVRTEGRSLFIICPACLEVEEKEKEVQRKRQSMVIMTEMNRRR